MSEAKATHHRWDDVTREQLSPAIARRMISTDRVTLVQFNLEQGALVAEHAHPNEQVTYIVEGHLRFRLGADGADVVDVRSGEVLHIPPDLPHSADVVVVGIGVVPTTDWLAGSGLDVDNGVRADATLHAADDVVVAGDMARWFDERIGDEIRIEHWTNAAEQGAAAARSLLAGRRQAVSYSPVPYFWSDQYDTKIQMIGHPHPDDEIIVVDGTLEDRRFVALYGRAGKLTAAIGFGRPRQLMGFRPMVEAQVSLDEARAPRPA